MKNIHGFAGKFSGLFCISVLLIIFSSSVCAQEMTDVVYLKNGGMIRGLIIEQVPNQSLKIRTKDGNIFVYSFSEIEKITKEEIQESAGAKSDFRSQPVPITSLLIQPLGVLQFGPVIEAEFRIAPSTIIGPRIRLHGAGILSHVAMDYDELYVSTIAIGIHFKQFLGPINSSDRFYIGAVMEYGTGGGIDEEEYWINNHYEDAEYEFSFISFATNFGYRWRFPSGFFLGVGAIAGAAVELTDEMIKPESIEYENDTFFFGMLELTLGLEL